ncbi:hypothetical protein F7725_006927 [Dissostichus mawsoni]|uniref:Uncharacterized protein n=1 Tax=Dissostichus mawsoni TaxID=36200 RepID=A0A7J5XVB2_DISMA|nr:hypothetical protein F7725_006927 [Dissostichus mawsoni]
MGIAGSGMMGVDGSGMMGVVGSGMMGIAGSGMMGVDGSGMMGVDGSGMMGVMAECFALHRARCLMKSALRSPPDSLQLLLHASLKDEREAPLSHAMYDEEGVNARQMKEKHPTAVSREKRGRKAAERRGWWADSQRPRGTENKRRRRVKGEEGRSQVFQKDAAVETPSQSQLALQPSSICCPGYFHAVTQPDSSAMEKCPEDDNDRTGEDTEEDTEGDKEGDTETGEMVWAGDGGKNGWMAAGPSSQSDTEVWLCEGVITVQRGGARSGSESRLISRCHSATVGFRREGQPKEAYRNQACSAGHVRRREKKKLTDCTVRVSYQIVSEKICLTHSFFKDTTFRFRTEGRISKDIAEVEAGPNDHGIAFVCGGRKQMGDYGFGVLVQNNTGNKSAFPVRIHPHLQPPHHHQNVSQSPAAFINSTTAAGNGTTGGSPWLFPASATHNSVQDEILGGQEKPKAQQQQEMQETQEKQQQLSPGSHQEVGNGGGIISELEKARSEDAKTDNGTSEGSNGKEKQLRLESPVLTGFDYQETSGLGGNGQVQSSTTSSSLTSFNNWSAAIPPAPSTIINEDVSFFNPASANNGPLLFQNFSHHVSPGFGGNFSPQIGPAAALSQHHPAPPPHPHFQHPHNQHQQHRRSPASPHPPPPFPHRNPAFSQLPHLSNSLNKPPSPWGPASYQSPSPSPGPPPPGVPEEAMGVVAVAGEGLRAEIIAEG